MYNEVGRCRGVLVLALGVDVEVDAVPDSNLDIALDTEPLRVRLVLERAESLRVRVEPDDVDEPVFCE